jgi:hypothetical protein
MTKVSWEVLSDLPPLKNDLTILLCEVLPWLRFPNLILFPGDSAGSHCWSLRLGVLDGIFDNVRIVQVPPSYMHCKSTVDSNRVPLELIPLIVCRSMYRNHRNHPPSYSYYDRPTHRWANHHRYWSWYKHCHHSICKTPLVHFLQASLIRLTTVASRSFIRSQPWRSHHRRSSPHHLRPRHLKLDLFRCVARYNVPPMAVSHCLPMYLCALSHLHRTVPCRVATMDRTSRIHSESTRGGCSIERLE